MREESPDFKRIQELETERDSLNKELERIKQAKSVVLCTCGHDGFSDVGEHMRCQECGRKTVKEWYNRKQKAIREAKQCHTK